MQQPNPSAHNGPATAELFSSRLQLSTAGVMAAAHEMRVALTAYDGAMATIHEAQNRLLAAERTYMRARREFEALIDSAEYPTPTIAA